MLECKGETIVVLIFPRRIDMKKDTKICFSWSCNFSKRSVLPLYEAAKDAGCDADLLPRGPYTDLPIRMIQYTHFVYGVGPDISWQMARDQGVIGINVMHEQYIFDTWVAPVPDHILFTGEAYVENAKKTLSQKAWLYSPVYILAGDIESINQKRT